MSCSQMNGFKLKRSQVIHRPRVSPCCPCNWTCPVNPRRKAWNGSSPCEGAVVSLQAHCRCQSRLTSPSALGLSHIFCSYSFGWYPELMTTDEGFRVWFFLGPKEDLANHQMNQEEEAWKKTENKSSEKFMTACGTGLVSNTCVTDSPEEGCKAKSSFSSVWDLGASAYCSFDQIDSSQVKPAI